MKNKALVIFGIATYILSVITSATNPQGESTIPPALLLISGLLTIVFIIMATIRLWKYSKGSSILFASSSIFYIGAAIAQVVYSPSDGSPLILIMNIAKVINVLVFIWTVSLLWRMEKNKEPFESLQPPTALDKMKYETFFARYLWGLFQAATITFVIGKLIGYFGFLSWWFVTAPFITCILSSIVNYLDWVPESRILLYTVYMVYATLRYAILRIILWMPIFLALFTGFCIVKKYGSDFGGISIAIVATIATYFLTIKLSGRSPGMPT